MRRVFALVISGRRRFGSSTRAGRNSIEEPLFVISIIISANDFTVCSTGLPKFIGIVSVEL